LYSRYRDSLLIEILGSSNQEGNKMSNEAKGKKAEIIDNLKEDFSKSSIMILTDYRGLSNSEITNLRRKLQGSGINYRVVKNTLARFAAERAGMSVFADSFQGPVAIALGYDDITVPAKVLTGYIDQTQGLLKIKGGFYGGRVLTVDEVKTISTLPSREILLARVIGQIKSPITSLVGCLSSPLRGLAGVLQARINQLEEN
jgi:large subunit ribosomal protein L10